MLRLVDRFMRVAGCWIRKRSGDVETEKQHMATEKQSFPLMPLSNWFALRKKFRATLPAKVTPSYLGSALSMKEESARINILPSPRSTSLIDEDGKPTDRAVKWRDDAQYTQVCDDIRKEVYPQELLDLASDSSADRELTTLSLICERWRKNSSTWRVYGSECKSVNATQPHPPR